MPPPQATPKGWRADVFEAQQLLNQLGYQSGEPNGILDPQTTTALKQFQAARGMTPNGVLDVDVLTALRAAYEIAR
jgi:membrane-bound lytic murein transglycosylase B